MKNRFLQRTALVSTVALMTGCGSLFGPEGYFRDHSSDYQKADVIEPMVVPPGVAIQNVDDLYRIPAIKQQSIDVSGGFDVPRPQPLGESAFSDRVKIQSLSGERWILVSEKPSEVWPHVRRFLSLNRLGVSFTDATTGVIETDWLRFKDDEDNKDKYRLQIEQGVQPDSTEIHIRHVSVNKEDSTKAPVVWPKASVNTERESWLVDELSGALASLSSTAQAASLLAQTIGVGDKVDLIKDGGEPILRLKLSYSRAWATLSQSVQKNGFHTWDRDDQLGVAYVQYQAQEETAKGWFLSAFTDSNAAPQTPYSLSEVLEHLQFDDTNTTIFSSMSHAAKAPLDDVPGYLVIIRGQSGAIDVRVRNGYGTVLPEKQARHLLNLIRRNLI